MGKIIYLPIGLSYYDIDIPLQIDITYIGGGVTDTRNITSSLVNGVIFGGFGSIPYDLKSYSLYSGIKVWAAFKPNRGSSYHPSGMALQSGTPKIFIYEKPTDATGYRLSDFAGYNHQCPIPGVVTQTTGITFSVSNPNVVIPTLIRFPEVDMRYFFPTDASEGVGIIIETWVNPTYSTLNNTYYKRLGYSVDYSGGVYYEVADLSTIDDILKYPHTINTFPLFKGGGITTNTNYKIKVFIGKLTLNSFDGTYYVVDKTHFPTNALSVCEYTGLATYVTSPTVNWVMEDDRLPFKPYSETAFYDISDNIIIPNTHYPPQVGTKDLEVLIYKFIWNSEVWDRDQVENDYLYGGTYATDRMYVRIFVRDSSLTTIYNVKSQVLLPTGSGSSYVMFKTNTNKFTLTGMPRNFQDGDSVIVYLGVTDPDIK